MNDGYYELISGDRRRAALELIKAEHALVRIFRNLDDEEAYDLAISENQDRDALTDMERADICLRLQKEGRTIDQIAHRMGWKGDAMSTVISASHAKRPPSSAKRSSRAASG